MLLEAKLGCAMVLCSYLYYILIQIMCIVVMCFVFSSLESTLSFPKGTINYRICIHMQHIGDSFPTRAVWNGGDIRTGSSRQRRRKRHFCCGLHHVDHISHLTGHTQIRLFLYLDFLYLSSSNNSRVNFNHSDLGNLSVFAHVIRENRYANL